MKTTLHKPSSAGATLKSSDLHSLESLIKAGAISKGLIQQLVAGATVTLARAVDQWHKWLTDVAGSDRTAICHHSYVSMWIGSMWIGQARLSPAKTRLSDITSAHISNFINARDGTKVATRRARLAALRSFFKFCTIRNYLSFDPSREVRIKTKLLTHEQIEPAEKLCFLDVEIQAIDDSLMARVVDLMGAPDTPGARSKLAWAQFWRAAVGIGRWSGLRLGDICCMEKAQLAKPGKLIVWTDKRSARVELPISENLARAIALIPASNDKRFCFPEQSRIHSDPHKRSKLSVQFMRILEGCGIKGKSFHSLRHTLVSELHIQGQSIEEIAKAIGHGSKESTMAYIHAPQQTDTATGTLPR